MAVDKSMRGQGLGSQLVDFAIAISVSISEHVGCRLLVTDAKQSAVKFYEKAGFTHVYIHQVGPDQDGFLDFYSSEILPRYAKATVGA